MKIQAVNSLITENGCRPPLKPAEFGGKRIIDKKAPDLNTLIEQTNTENPDTFVSSEPYTTDQKYNLACQVAAYYKTQYEELVNERGCLA